MAEPIIAVTINYRLNMFAFGDCASERNLALRDQQRALEFVKTHISGFGGDPVSSIQVITFLPPWCRGSLPAFPNWCMSSVGKYHHCW